MRRLLTSVVVTCLVVGLALVVASSERISRVTSSTAFRLGRASMPAHRISSSALTDTVINDEIGSSRAAASEWPMAGANPQRTSWSPEEVRGPLSPVWYKPIEPYIPQKAQIIAANDTLYVSTSRGLYALAAATGDERWVYATELPLGHSPTIHNNVAYIPGLDHKIHAVNAETGRGLWTFEAEAGFQTNPVVVDDLVYAGNRDGYMYAVYANHHPLRGSLAWKYGTEGPVLYSAAYDDGVIYFASNDSHAYALGAQTGELIWRSAKLPGAGFHSWWPVVYRDKVIFSGSPNYRALVPPGPEDTLDGLDRNDVYPNRATEPPGAFVGPVGREPGDWASGTKTVDAQRVIDYFEAKPWRRTYFVLQRQTGEEYTFDSDSDGVEEYAPVLWHGTQNGNRYPPVVGIDDVIYQSNNYQSDEWIPAGSISGWKIGTQHISVPSGAWLAVDEPLAYSAGGDLIYWNHCCDRQVGAVDITTTNPVQEWFYLDYNIHDVIPGYDIMYSPPFNRNDWPGAYGGQNGIYSSHGDQNAPVPYKGKVYVHRSNTVIAFGEHSGPTRALPMFRIVEVHNASVTAPSVGQLKKKLAIEVEKMVDAGHLRAGYGDAGLFNGQYGDALLDYWHNPADTIYTLIRALPHLPPGLQTRTRAYIQREFTNYPPYTVTHVGFKDGAPREVFDLPPEVESARRSFGPIVGVDPPPHAFYALWKYAELFGNGRAIFTNSRNRLAPSLADAEFRERPDQLNSYIAGYWGYLELERLAGYPESRDVRAELDRLLELRVSTFSKDTPYPNPRYPNFLELYLNSLNVARNFMYLTPELGQYLRDNAPARVQEAVDEYDRVAPYWFVSKTEQALGENAIQHYYDVNALFQARSLILEESREELAKYLDVPAFKVGDLFYIQNLIATIEAGSAHVVTPTPTATRPPSVTPTQTATTLPSPSFTMTPEPSRHKTYVPLVVYDGLRPPTGTSTPTPVTPTATKTPPPTRTPAPAPTTTSWSRRVNAPYFDDEDVRFSETAIFWFGRVTPTENYADVRVGYNNVELHLYLAAFDRRLWYDVDPSPDDLTAWDSVTFYLDLNGNLGNTIDNNAYRFTTQLTWWESGTDWQAAHQGDRGDWIAVDVPIVSETGWRGTEPNSDQDDRGWVAFARIPFTSLGLVGPPAKGSVWGLGVVLHDRDDAVGTSIIPDKTWPEEMEPQRPATWGQLAFGIPDYDPPPATPEGTAIIRHDMGGLSVVDAAVGGHSVCGQGLDLWTEWGEANYAGYDQFNVQNQQDVADWSCFSKYYVTFPLDTIPRDKVIISATLTLHQLGNAGEGWDPGPQPALIQVLTVDQDWGEGTLAWNNAPLAKENVAAAWVDPLESAVGLPGVPREWDVSRAAADAHAANDPLRLVLYSADGPYHSGRYFWSSDARGWNAEGTPALQVIWGDPE